MQAEASVPSEHRYLSVVAQLTDQRFVEVKNRTIAWCAENPERLNSSYVAALDVLRSIDTGPNIMAVVAMACYADIPRGRIYNAAFHCHKRCEVEETYAKLCLSILRERLPMEGLEHGHHQVAIFDFPNGVPLLLKRLPKCDGNQLLPLPDIGLCDMGNWSSIQAGKSIARCSMVAPP